jgi:antitoxin (DNA-binding transcriptional repressor) of toxin-antitoxin stability system
MRPSVSPTHSRSHSTSGQVVGVPGALGPFYGWAPDSNYFTAGIESGIGFFDLSGLQIASIESRNANWVSANSIAVVEAGRLRFFDLSGSETGSISGDFEGLVVASDAGVFAAVLPPTADDAIGTTYRVWDGSVLSEVRDGVPVALTGDGSTLAVLVPLAGPGNGPPGRLGHLSLVDRSGTTLFELTDWVSDARSLFTFSPDGNYLAACFEETAGGLPALRIVDAMTAEVSAALGRCGYASWTEDDTLYSSFLSDGTHTWKPQEGVTDSGFPPETVAIAAPNGLMATWSAPDTATLTVTDGVDAANYELSGAILYAYWSPDGSTLGMVSASTSPSAYELTLIRLDAVQ